MRDKILRNPKENSEVKTALNSNGGYVPQTTIAPVTPAKPFETENASDVCIVLYSLLITLQYVIIECLYHRFVMLAKYVLKNSSS